MLLFIWDPDLTFKRTDPEPTFFRRRIRIRNPGYVAKNVSLTFPKKMR